MYKLIIVLLIILSLLAGCGILMSPLKPASAKTIDSYD